MIVIGLTGGIATGKSTFADLCRERMAALVISADAVVHALYETEEVIGILSSRYGRGLLREGRVDRGLLGRRAFADPGERRWLEEQFHPRVLARLREAVQEERVRPGGASVVIVEVPLLYEVDFPLERDIDVVVACAPGTQLQRVQGRNRLDLEGAKERIAAQLPISDKVRRADVVIWNEGSRTLLDRQARLLAALINHKDS